MEAGGTEQKFPLISEAEAGLPAQLGTVARVGCSAAVHGDLQGEGRERIRARGSVSSGTSVTAEATGQTETPTAAVQ